MDDSPADALARLNDLGRRGGLDDVMEQLGIEVLLAFGSAARGEPDPVDLDLAYVGSSPPWTVVDVLCEVLAFRDLDAVDLSAADPLVAARAARDGIGIYEDEPGRLVAVVVDAMMREMDTRWLREAAFDAAMGRPSVLR